MDKINQYFTIGGFNSVTGVAYGDYGLRVCPTCKGTGINPILITNVCPKCNGETKIPFKDRRLWND